METFKWQPTTKITIVNGTVVFHRRNTSTGQWYKL